MPRRPLPTLRQQQIDAAVAAELERNPAADYRDLARAAGTSTAQIRAALVRLGLPTDATSRAALAGYAQGWNAALAAHGHPDA